MTEREVLRPVLYDDRRDEVRLLDQRLLPGEETWLALATADEVAEAIRTLAVRGAPAIGVAAAYGLAVEARRGATPERLRAAAELLARARPTAVNLEWAVRRMSLRIGEHRGGHPGRGPRHPRRGRGLLPAHRRPGSAPPAPRGPRPHPLQRRCARHGGLRHRARDRAGREGGGAARARLRRRDPPLLPGGAPHRLGTPAGRHPRHHPHRRHGRLAHGPRGDLLRGGGGRPHRRQRRRGQQDRHLRPRRAGPPPRHPVLRGGALEHVRPLARPPAPASPSRSATPTRWCASSVASWRRRACRPATRPSTSPPPVSSRPSSPSGACSGLPTARPSRRSSVRRPSVPTDGDPRRRVTRLPGSGREVLSIGLRTAPLRDLYHSLLTATWSRFFGIVLVAYLGANLLFALAYLSIGDGIEQARRGNFADAFFFSVQTMATIGYGKMAPHGLAANLLVTFEALVGLLGLALVTGLVFAKFSRPTARVRLQPERRHHPLRRGALAARPDGERARKPDRRGPGPPGAAAHRAHARGGGGPAHDRPPARARPVGLLRLHLAHRPPHHEGEPALRRDPGEPAREGRGPRRLHDRARRDAVPVGARPPRLDHRAESSGATASPTSS